MSGWFSFPRPFRAQSPTTAGDRDFPHLVIVIVLIVNANYPVPTCVKAVCIYSFILLLSNPRDFPALLSPTSLINHQWISCSPVPPPPLFVIYKVRCKIAILQSIPSICWDFASWQVVVISSVQIKLIKILTVWTFLFLTLTIPFLISSSSLRARMTNFVLLCICAESGTETRLDKDWLKKKSHMKGQIPSATCFCFVLVFWRFYLFVERGGGREKERERNINVWLPLTCPFLGS